VAQGEEPKFKPQDCKKKKKLKGRQKNERSFFLDPLELESVGRKGVVGWCST
jgi:hypothetical protein